MRIRAALATTVALAAVVATLPGAPAGAAAGHARAWDFDGDGRGDLAVGAPGEDDLAGAVTAMPGTRHGLAASKGQRFGQDTSSVPGTARSGDLFGARLASGDFDGDGHADLAVTAPSDDDAEVGEGTVTVVYGSSAGLRPATATLLVQPAQVYGVTADPDESRFGLLVAAADFERDGYVDLVVGSDSGSGPQGVLVYHGAAAGLRTAPAEELSPGHGLPPGDSTSLNALAVGDLDGNGAPDLALAQQEAGQAAGAVTVVYAARRRGLDVDGSEVRPPQLWTRATDGVKGEDVTDEAFGAGVAVGDVTGDGVRDLVITAKHIPPGDAGTGGAVQVLRGTPQGVTARHDELLRYDDLVDDPVGSFGSALAAGDVNRDGVADVAVTHASAVANEAGAVLVLYGGDGGLSVSRRRDFTQGSDGVVGGTTPQVDYWGLGLRIGDAGRSGAPDLVVGDPFEPVAGADAGIVTVLWGSRHRVSGTRSAAVTETTSGIPGTPESGDRFGLGL